LKLDGKIPASNIELRTVVAPLEVDLQTLLLLLIPLFSPGLVFDKIFPSRPHA